MDGPEVTYYWYSDEAEQARFIIRSVQKLLSEGIPPGEMTILSRLRQEHSCLRDHLQKLPFRLVDISKTKQNGSAVNFSTVSSFKGLESTAAFVIGVNNLTDHEELSNLYVATSRARVLLVVFADKKISADYQQRAFDYGERLRRKAIAAPGFEVS